MTVMDSASIQFVFFGLAAAILSNFSRSPIWRSAVLLLASLVFLGLLARDPILFLPLAGFLVLGYSCVWMVKRRWPSAVTWSVLAVLFSYIWLKKYTILPEAIFLHRPYFTLGLSYIFFFVSFTSSSGSGEDNQTRSVSFVDYLLYTLNFTTFVSGSIQRYEDFAQDQFAMTPIHLDANVVGLQLERIVRGFFKVNVLAMILHAIQEDSLAQMYQPLPLPSKLFAAFRLLVAYPFFLYANFSGYIDIVIALARLMRIRLPENPIVLFLPRPFWTSGTAGILHFLSGSRPMFYYPLLTVMMRRISSTVLYQIVAGVICFFVTFFLVGVWHGRTSEYVFFGILQGGGVAINKIWQIWLGQALGRKRYKALAANPVYIAFGRGLTFSWFAFTLFWFWASWSQIDRVFSSLAVTLWLVVWIACWLCSVAVFALWEWLRAALLSIRCSDGPILTGRYARVIYASTLGLVAFVVTVLLNQPAPGIIYKTF